MSTRAIFCLVGIAILSVLVLPVISSAEQRSERHQDYAETLWKYLGNEKSPYSRWKQAETAIEMPMGPRVDDRCKSYLNPTAATNLEALPVGALIVTEHCCQEGSVHGVTAWIRMPEGYDSENGDWYWVHYAPNGKVAKTSVDKAPFAKRGFATFLDDGRLWVFRIGGEPLVDYLTSGEPAKCAIRPGAGPGGITIKSSDLHAIVEYMITKPGYVTMIDDGRLWVFREGSEALAEFREKGEPAKIAIRPAAGPMGMTVKGPDSETVEAYIMSKPGYATRIDDGRLWVFREGSKELTDYDAGLEPAKIVIRPAALDGITLKSPDNETLLGYVAAQEGFTTFIEDGRIWVFKPASADLAQFTKMGDLAKRVIRPGAGPLGMTVMAPDVETIESYLRSGSKKRG